MDKMRFQSTLPSYCYNDSRANPEPGDNPVSYRFDVKNFVFPKADLLFWFSLVEANIQCAWFSLESGTWTTSGIWVNEPVIAISGAH